MSTVFNFSARPGKLSKIKHSMLKYYSIIKVSYCQHSRTLFLMRKVKLFHLCVNADKTFMVSTSLNQQFSVVKINKSPPCQKPKCQRSNVYQLFDLCTKLTNNTIFYLNALHSNDIKNVTGACGNEINLSCYLFKFEFTFCN